MAFIFKINNTTFLVFNKFNIPKNAKNIRRVDARKKRFQNLKPTKNGFKVL